MTPYIDMFISDKINMESNTRSEILKGAVSTSFPHKNIYYCVTCEVNSDMLYIYTMMEYNKRQLYKRDGILVGVTNGKKEMEDFIVSLTEKTLKETGTADIYTYIHKRNGK